ncbi:aldehyde dehydrogenase family protein [Hartmannibacter diazotrophicus]|nr:aldehyde dehydrogenase family protein [Hartmannibacter diazotrophicus]
MSLNFDPNGLTLPFGHLIDGERVAAGGAEIPVARPSDGREVGRIHAADADLVDRAVQAAHRAFRTSGWAEADPLERAAVLKRWADLIDARRIEIARIEAATTTRPVEDLVNRDLVRAAGALRYFAEWADKVEGSLLATAAGRTSMVKPEPWGVIASIAPFNFPAINAIWKSAPALAVGNAVVLKPSEMTPCSAVVMAELALEAGLPRGLFNVIQGAGATGSALVRHPLVSKITFTGSSATGARVMADAAETGTKPVTLELGGKSPQLVLKDVRNLDAVALNVANGFLANAGQVCTAGTRLIVPETLHDDLLERVISIANGRRAGPTWQTGNTMPPIISEKQAQRIDAMLAETVSDGAEVMAGGGRDPSQNAGAYYRPTILRGVPEHSIGFRGEFFGPVLSVYTYADEEEGIAMANHPLYGLAASVYTDDAGKALSLPSRIDAGTVWVNAHGRQPDFATPQGGFKGSGFGKEMGRAGLESFLRFKTVWLQHG